MDDSVHILLIEDREEHILQARVLLHRLPRPVKIYIARTIIEGEKLARHLLDLKHGLTVVILSDIHLPLASYSAGIDGTYLLNLLADDIRGNRLAQGILIAVSSEMTPERFALGSHATAELWHKPLNHTHLARLSDLLGQGPPWVLPREPQSAGQESIIRDVMAMARHMWLNLRPDAAAQTGKSILGILTKAITLSPDEYKDGLILVNQYGGANVLRAFLRRHPQNEQLSAQERRFLIDLLDGLPQSTALTRAQLTRRKSKLVLNTLYRHISTLVLTKD
jgi:CheY-like chemotaxis protein